jgi:hypothetical protein
MKSINRFVISLIAIHLASFAFSQVKSTLPWTFELMRDDVTVTPISKAEFDAWNPTTTKQPNGTPCGQLVRQEDWFSRVGNPLMFYLMVPKDCIDISPDAEGDTEIWIQFEFDYNGDFTKYLVKNFIARWESGNSFLVKMDFIGGGKQHLVIWRVAKK